MTPLENTYRVFGQFMGTTNRVLIIFQYLIFILLNIMLTKKCVTKIIWDGDDSFWKTAISFGVVCVILIIIINLGIAKFSRFSYLVPLSIIFAFIIYNAVELGFFITRDGNHITIDKTGISMKLRELKKICKVPLLTMDRKIFANFGEAISFWLSIYSIPSYFLRLPKTEAKKLNIRLMVLYVFVIVFCCSIIYLPWTICNYNEDRQTSVIDFIDNTFNLEKQNVV